MPKIPAISLARYYAQFRSNPGLNWAALALQEVESKTNQIIAAVNSPGAAPAATTKKTAGGIAAANGSTGLGTYLEEVVAFTGTAGSLSHTPTLLLGIFRNGIRMTSLAGSPAIQTFTMSSPPAVVLSVAAGGSDVFIAQYFY